jgi:hypothetical protein
MKLKKLKLYDWYAAILKINHWTWSWEKIFLAHWYFFDTS